MINYYGLNFNITDLAVETCYRFPASKHRSRRVHKKMVKRFGTQRCEKPAAYRVGGEIVIHPSLLQALIFSMGEEAKQVARTPKTIEQIVPTIQEMVDGRV